MPARSPSPPLHLGSIEVEHRSESLVTVARSVDAVVSSDDNYLSHGGGVSAALWSAAREVDTSRLPLPASLGDVLETRAGRLGCAHLYHAISIDLDTGERANAGQVRDLTGRVVERAIRDGVKSIAMPVFASGAGLLGPRVAAVAMLEGLAIAAEWMTVAPERVVIATLPRDGSTDDAVRRALASIVTREALEQKLGEFEIAAGIGEAPPKAADDLSLVERSIDAALAFARGSAALPRPSASANIREKARALFELLDAAEGPSRLPLAGLLSELVQDRNALAHSVDARPVQAMRIVAMRQRTATFIDLCLAVGRPNQVVPSRDTSPRDTSLGAYEFASSGVHGVVREQVTAYAKPMVVAPLGGAVGLIFNALGKSFRRPEAPDSPPPSPRVEVPAIGSLDGDGNSHNAPVRNLARLAREVFAAADLQILDEALVKAGYRGSPEDRLLEHCVRVPHPARWLVNHLTASQIRWLLESRGRSAPLDLDSPDLAERLLIELGFPPVGEPRGLRHAIRALENARSRVHGVDVPELRGLIVASGAEVEHVLLVLLRFVSLVAFKKPPEVLLDTSPTEARAPLARRGLGALLELVITLSRKLAEAPEAERFRQDFGYSTLVPKGFDASRCAQLRNRFAHDGREFSPHDEGRREDAAEFLQRGLTLLEFLAGHGDRQRVFPRVIVPRKIVIDSWDRRVVEADSDDGPSEFVFTDHILRPGRVYYMHAFTNPFRIDPVLVAADDMVEAGGASSVSASERP